jgi:formylglycine-generating enzyme
MYCHNCIRLAVVFFLVLSAATAQAVTIDLVPVGNPNNAPDTRYATPGYGSVGYTYAIGKYEITAGQYCEFLNAVAATDTYGLYATPMYSASHGCMIRQLGSSGSYTYLVDANGDGATDLDWVNRPVNLVSWGDAARFCNWLQNGQPTGPQALATTEDGTYYLNGATTSAALMAVTRKPGLKWAIPNEDEWYKAAYHKNDGVTGSYWDYPTGTDTPPSNALINPDPGNNANFFGTDYTIGNPYYRTPVGEFENSESPYGTFDQGGNIHEWNETAVTTLTRGERGGSYGGSLIVLAASFRSDEDPVLGQYSSGTGFRVARVPEPSTIALLVAGGISLLAYVWRRRKHGA